MTPLTALEPGVEMFERGNPQSFFPAALTARSSKERPTSYVSIAYTDIEDDSSEFEEYSGSSVSVNCNTWYAPLTTNRATTDGVRPPYPPLKKPRRQNLKDDPILLNGICQSQ